MNVRKFIIVSLVLILGFLLRFHNYDVYPQRGATSDEYTYSFLGLSLLTKGVPISWSHFGAYKNRREVIIDTINFPLVQPYFDHPPLAGILVGSWALVNGEDTFESLQLSTIRIIPLVLSVFSSILLFLLAYRLTNYITALWALLIYSTVTIFAIQSRVVLAENVLTPIFLIAAYLYHCWKKQMTPSKVLVLGFFAGAAFWVKEAGIALFLSLSLLFLREKVKKQYFTIFICTVMLAVVGYALYGARFGWETFINIINLQGTRDVGPQTLWNLISTPVIVNKIYYDGWYYFGFFSLALLLSRLKQYLHVITPALIYFLFLLFSLTKEGMSGWYMIPMFPFMAIASAIVLQRAVETVDLTYVTFLLLVGFSFVQYSFQRVFGLTGGQYRIFFVLLIVPFVLSFFLQTTKFARILAHIYFYVAIGISTYATLYYVHPV